MKASDTARTTGILGLAMIVLVAAANALAPTSNLPGTGATSIEVMRYFGGHHNALREALYLYGAGFVVLVPFVSGLRDYLRSSEPDASVSNVGFAAGSVLAAVTLAALACFVVAVYRLAPRNPEIVSNFYDLGWAAVALSGFAAALCVGAFSFVIVTKGGLPSWSGWLGFAVGIAHLVSAAAFARNEGVLSLEGGIAVYVPLSLYLWLLVVSVLLLRAPRGAAAASG